MQLFYLQATILMCLQAHVPLSFILRRTIQNGLSLQNWDMESLSMKICHGKSPCCLSRLSCEISGNFFDFHQICHLLQSKLHWWKKWLIILHINLLWLLGNILWWLLFLDIFGPLCLPCSQVPAFSPSSQVFPVFSLGL